MKILQVDFTYSGPWGEEMSQAMKDLALSISEEEGLIWKIWTEDQEAGTAGGIYLFADGATAKAYLDMHSARLEQGGCTAIRGKIFDINTPLSKLNRAPI